MVGLRGRVADGAEIVRLVHERAVVIHVDEGFFEERGDGGGVGDGFGLVPSALKLDQLGFVIGGFGAAADECSCAERQHGEKKSGGFFHESYSPSVT